MLAYNMADITDNSVSQWLHCALQGACINRSSGYDVSITNIPQTKKYSNNHKELKCDIPGI